MKDIRSMRGVESRYLSATVPAAHSGIIPPVVDGGASIFITGPTGTGKTYLASALILAIGIKKNRGNLHHVPTMLNQAMAEYVTESRRTMNEMTEYPIIALDDLGMEKPTDRTMEAIDIIVDRRYSRELQTIITTNMTMQDVAKFYGDRVSSRLSDMCMILRLAGKDRRIK